MVLIFCLSAQPADTSSALSGGLLRLVMRVLVPGFEQLSQAAQETRLELFHTVFRKLAHFSVYAVLGVLWTLTLRGTGWPKGRFGWRIWMPVLLSLLYAVSDEIHQFYTDGRSCELRDVGIDGLGACVGIGLLYGIRGLLLLLRRRTARRQTNRTARRTTRVTRKQARRHSEPQ